jgi:hypothetical protein
VEYSCALGAGRVLAVGIEPVDAKLDLGEDATGGIQLAVSYSCRYHLRNVVRSTLSGAVYGVIQRPAIGEGRGLAVGVGYKSG